jgi:hypothetical protein
MCPKRSLNKSRSGGILRTTWIDLCSVLWSWLIATTIKSAKGESVFANSDPRHPVAGGFFLGRIATKEYRVSASPVSGSIRGLEGDLVSVRILTDPRRLEDLLEALATADFPVNPQLYHQLSRVVVEFPAYACQIDRLKRLISASGFEEDAMRVHGPLDPMDAEY